MEAVPAKPLDRIGVPDLGCESQGPDLNLGWEAREELESVWLWDLGRHSRYVEVVMLWQLNEGLRSRVLFLPRG